MDLLNKNKVLLFKARKLTGELLLLNYNISLPDYPYILNNRNILNSLYRVHYFPDSRSWSSFRRRQTNGMLSYCRFSLILKGMTDSVAVLDGQEAICVPSASCVRKGFTGSSLVVVVNPDHVFHARS